MYLTTQSEEDIATFLILAPKIYHTDFLEFGATFDQLLELFIPLLQNSKQVLMPVML